MFFLAKSVTIVGSSIYTFLLIRICNYLFGNEIKIEDFLANYTQQNVDFNRPFAGSSILRGIIE
jgi:hypothetical protein